MKQLRVLLPPPGRWDASPSQGYPQQCVSFIRLGGERQCGVKFLVLCWGMRGKKSTMDFMIIFFGRQAATTPFPLLFTSDEVHLRLSLCFNLPFFYLFSVNCPPGSREDLNGTLSACFLCPAGTYQPYEGQTSCIPCPSGSKSGRTGLEKVSSCKGETSSAGICKGCLPRVGFFHLL